MGRRPSERGVDVGAVDRLTIEEDLDESVERVPAVGEQTQGALLGLAKQAAHLLVDDPLGGLGEGATADLLGAEVNRNR